MGTALRYDECAGRGGKGSLRKPGHARQKKSGDIKRVSIGGQLKADGFYTYYVVLDTEDTLYSYNIQNWGRILGRGELVLGARTPCKDFMDRVFLPWHAQTSTV